MPKNLMFVRIDKFLYQDDVYHYSRKLNKYKTEEKWDSKNVCSFHYTLERVPDNSTVIEWHVVKGGYI